MTFWDLLGPSGTSDSRRCVCLIHGIKRVTDCVTDQIACRELMKRENRKLHLFTGYLFDKRTRLVILILRLNVGIINGNCVFVWQSTCSVVCAHQN